MGLFAFVVAIAMISPFPDGAAGVKWVLLSIFVPAAFLIRRGEPPTIGHGFLLVFLWWSAVTILWTPVIVDGFYTGWHLVLFAALTFIVTDMRKVYIGAGIALAVNGLFVLVQMLGLDPVTQAVPPAGLWFNKNAGAEITALVLIGLVLTTGWRWWLACSPILFTLAAPPLSRAPIVALCVAGALWIWERSRFYGYCAFGLGAAVLIFLVTKSDRVVHGSLRLKLWYDTTMELTLWGHGLGSFVAFQPWFEFAHNDYLQIMYELGAPGLALFGAFLIYCLRGREPTERLVLVAFMVEGCFGFPLFMPGTVMVAALAAGQLLRDRPLVRDLLPER